MLKIYSLHVLQGKIGAISHQEYFGFQIQKFNVFIHTQWSSHCYIYTVHIQYQLKYANKMTGLTQRL